MGAVSGSLIGAYVIYPHFWFLLVVIGSLAGFSLFFGFVVRYTFYSPKSNRKKRKS